MKRYLSESLGEQGAAAGQPACAALQSESSAVRLLAHHQSSAQVPCALSWLVQDRSSAGWVDAAQAACSMVQACSAVYA